MTNQLSLPANAAPHVNGIPIQPITGLPLKPGERVILRRHPITRLPIADNDPEPTVEERMESLGPNRNHNHPILEQMLSQTPLNIEMIQFITALYPGNPVNTIHPSVALSPFSRTPTYSDLETNPKTIALSSHLTARSDLAAARVDLPEHIWQALLAYGHNNVFYSLAHNPHCPEHIRIQAGLRIPIVPHHR